MCLIVFDPSITRVSPIGSCFITLLQPLIGQWPIRLFTNENDLPDSPLVQETKVPLPGGPVFLRAVLFTLFCACAYAFSRKPKRRLTMSTESAFPFCDVCYSHYCHRIFLARHRDAVAGTWLRRSARLLTHRWGALCETLALRRAKTIVVPSRGIARDLERVYPAQVHGKIRVIPNPVDAAHFARPADFCSAAIHRQFGIPRGTLVLSFCALGNFERKGLRLLLEALLDLRNDNVHLLVIGGSSGEIDEYRALAGRLHVSDGVHFAGFASDVRPYLWSSHAFVFPSAYEGFALVCLQAAAAGLPLLATRVNGVEEFLIDGVNGWIVERTRSSIRSAIEKIATCFEQSAAMGRAAQEAVAGYSPERFQANWRALLAELVATPRA